MPAWWYFGKGRWLGNAKPPNDTHVLAKSTYESASIGISESSSLLVNERLETALDRISEALHQPVVVQAFIVGKEAETAVITSEFPVALAPVGIAAEGERNLGDRFLSFERGL